MQTLSSRFINIHQVYSRTPLRWLQFAFFWQRRIICFKIRVQFDTHFVNRRQPSESALPRPRQAASRSRPHHPTKNARERGKWTTKGPGLPNHIQGCKRDQASGAGRAPRHNGFTRLKGFVKWNANYSNEGFSHGKGHVKYLQAFRRARVLWRKG